MTTAREKWIEVKASQFAASAEPRSLEQTEQFARDAMALADQTRQACHLGPQHTEHDASCGHAPTPPPREQGDE